MKKSLFFVVILTLVSLTTAMAQKVSLQFEQKELGEVLANISKQTGYTFSYSNQVVNTKRNVSIDVQNENLSEVLKRLFNNSDVEFEISDNKKILLKQKSVNTAQIQQKTNQNGTVKGQVLDEKGFPIPGATIVVEGTDIGTITDFDGNYILENIPADSVISVSYVGFKVRKFPSSDKALAAIVLQEDTQELQEVVVIGYGTQSKRKVTGAISTVKAAKLVENLAVASFDQALASKLPGVNIQESNGAPGSAVNIKIRGTSSINFGGHPLIVVDGLPLSNSSFNENLQGKSTIPSFQSSYAINPLTSINSSDIESIEVLKDAASTAIYGSRGSNGVLIITTKKGKIGKPVVNFNMYSGIQKLSKKVDVMDAYELARYTKVSRDAAWAAVGGNTSDPLSVRKGSNYVYPDYMIPYLQGKTGLINTDWQDEIYRTALQQNYEISVGGGSEDIRYYISGNYMDKEGIIINSGLQRYNLRSNIDANITDKLRLGLRVSVGQTDNDLVQSEGNWWKEGAVISALMYHPNLPAYNPDGSLAINLMIDEIKKGQNIAKLQNPVALAKMELNKLQNRSFIGNGDLEYSISDALKVKTAFGVESLGLHRRFYRPKSLSHANELAPTENYNYGLDSRASIFNWISETSLIYNAYFGEHNLNLLGNFSAQKETISFSMLEGLNFPNDNVKTINAAATTTGSSFEQQSTMASFLGRAMYSYGSKYMLSASLRYDGSSRFASNSKWGWFPSLSAGWNISEEEFYPENALVNDLKLRASYGITGNAEIPYYAGISVLASRNYLFGNHIALGFSPENAPNKDLSWESTATTNIGVDMALWNNNLQITFDAYQSITHDLLLNVTIPSTSGLNQALQNVGKVRNRGVELMLSTYQEVNDWNFDFSLALSSNKNKVLALAPGQDQILFASGLSDPSFILKVGESVGSFYGYQILGKFETQQQFNSTPHLENANQSVGDFIYADTNHDGKVNEDDRVILGNANPDFIWGLNGKIGWKNFDFGFSIEGKHGQQVFNAMHRYLAETWGNNLSVYLDEKAPRPVWAYGTKSHTRPSSWHVEDASFIRIRNLALGYTFKEINYLEKLRVYISSTNPFTFTNYSGYNPEVSNGGSNAITAGEDFGNYPIAKSFTVGLNVTF